MVCGCARIPSPSALRDRPLRGRSLPVDLLSLPLTAETRAGSRQARDLGDVVGAECSERRRPRARASHQRHSLFSGRFLNPLFAPSLLLSSNMKRKSGQDEKKKVILGCEKLAGS